MLIFLIPDTDELRCFLSVLSTAWYRLIYLKFGTSLNIFLLVSLFSPNSKLDISRTIKLRHSENIFLKLVTFLVLKLDKSNDWIELHPENIEFISVTEEVSKDDKLIEINLVQP